MFRHLVSFKNEKMLWAEAWFWHQTDLDFNFISCVTLGMLLNLSLSFPYLGNGNNSYLEEISVLVITLNHKAYVKHLMIMGLRGYKKYSTKVNSLDSPFLSFLCPLLTYFSKSDTFLANTMRQEVTCSLWLKISVAEHKRIQEMKHTHRFQSICLWISQKSLSL